MKEAQDNMAGGSHCALPRSENRLFTILIMMGILLLSGGPLWAAELMHCTLSTRAALLLEYSLALALLPLGAAKCFPRLADFDRTWLPKRRSHFLWFFAMAAVWFLWIGNSYLILKSLGVPVTAFQGLPSYEITRWNTLVYALGGIVLGPVGEEMFFRGYALDQFEKALPRKTALLAQAALFSGAHFLRPPECVILFGMGVILGFWRQRMRSLLPLMALHMLQNGIALGPKYWDWYQFAREMDTPNGRLLRRIDQEPPTLDGLAQILPCFDDRNMTITVYAADILADKAQKLGVAADAQLAKALDSDNPRVQAHVALAVGHARRLLLIPKLREVALKTRNEGVLTGCLYALCRLRDKRGLEKVAASLPPGELRQKAETHIKHIESNEDLDLLAPQRGP